MDTGGARTSSRTGGAVAALDVEAVLAADAAVDSSLDFVAGFFLPEEGPVGGCLTGRPRFLGEALVVSSLVDAAAFLGGRPRFRAVGDDGVVVDSVVIALDDDSLVACPDQVVMDGQSSGLIIMILFNERLICFFNSLKHKACS